MTKKTPNRKGGSRDNGERQLSIPAYTEDKLAKYSTADLETIKARAEIRQEEGTVLMCLKVLEQRHKGTLGERRKKQMTNNEIQNQKMEDQFARPVKSDAIKWHFDDLEAPLTNSGWSWGAISRRNDEVVFRVWRDEIENFEGKLVVRLTYHSKFLRGRSLGYRERLEHLGHVKKGSRAFAVICDAKNEGIGKRSIKAYDRERIYPISVILKRGDDDWGVLSPGIKVSEYLGQQ